MSYEVPSYGAPIPAPPAPRPDSLAGRLRASCFAAGLDETSADELVDATLVCVRLRNAGPGDFVKALQVLRRLGKRNGVTTTDLESIALWARR